MLEIPYNLNEYVRVRLTERGRELLKNQKQDWRLTRGQINEEVNGWSRWQLWDLMHTFGQHIGMGMGIPFETNITIEVPEKK